MAHDIDTTTGRAAFFSRKPAWHGLGTVIDREVSTSEALVLAGCDYHVYEQVLPEVPTEHGLLDLGGQAKATYRLRSDGTPFKLGLVGADYQVIQNDQAFGFLDALCDPEADLLTDDTGAPIVTRRMPVETAGALRSGRSTFVTTYLPDDLVIDPDGVADRVRVYLAVLNSHDGTSGLRGLVTPTRIVCANTERVALRNARSKFSIQHRSRALDNLADARRALGITFAYTDVWAAQATAMARTEVTDAQWANIVERILAPAPKTEQKAAHTRNEQLRQQLDTLYRGPNNAPIAGTVWGAFNAWTEYLDHERSEQAEGNRATQLTEGAYADTKARVWGQLVKTYKVPTTAHTGEYAAALV